MIGNVATTSGIIGTEFAPAINALRAWVAMTNDAGGINGHPVQLITVDDGGDPARFRAAVQDLVENKRVIAFVANWAVHSGTAATTYLNQHRIPVVGGDSGQDGWFQSPMLFPVQPPPSKYTWIGLKALAALTRERNIALLACREAATCTQHADVIRRHAASFGFRLVYDAQASVAQPDFIAECLSAQRAGATVVIPIFDSASVRRIAHSCDRQDYRPRYVTAGVVEPDYAKDPAFEGTYIWNAGFSPFADTAVAARFREQFAKYAPNQAPLGNAVIGWAVGALFGKAASAAFPITARPSTPPLLDALWSLKNETVDGMLGPLTYRREKPSGPTAPHCIFVLGIRQGAFTAPTGMEPAGCL